MNRFQLIFYESNTRHVMILMPVVGHCRGLVLCLLWYIMYIDRLAKRTKIAIFKKDSFVVN
jgi:hypothetical protein